MIALILSGSVFLFSKISARFCNNSVVIFYIVTSVMNRRVSFVGLSRIEYPNLFCTVICDDIFL